MNGLRTFLFLTFLGSWLSSGCAQAASSSAQPDKPTDGWKVRTIDRDDYFACYDAKGRITQLGFDDNRDGHPDVRVKLAAVAGDGNCPHYVLMLDGVPFKVIESMYRQGHFRMFYPPSKLVSVFPSNTDTAYGEVLTPGQLNGYEAQYYDRESKKLSDGNSVYLKGKNEPWRAVVDYRVSLLLDPLGYVRPNFLFDHEMRAFARKMRGANCGMLRLYTVGTTMIETREGEPGIRKCLERVEAVCDRIMFDRRGHCRISMLSDHGHTLVKATYFDTSAILKRAGFNVARRLNNPNDVVIAEFGLVTYTAIYTDDPERVALCLLDQEPADLAVYPQELNGRRKIVVRDQEGMALVDKEGGRYRYETIQGDPLRLKPILDRLQKQGKVDRAGWIDDRAFWQATVDHMYPDPLARIWRAFNGLVKYPADLIVTLRDEWFAGSASFARSVNVASTHGSLNWNNTVTFMMSTIRPLPPAIRMEEIVRDFPEINR